MHNVSMAKRKRSDDVIYDSSLLSQISAIAVVKVRVRDSKIVLYHVRGGGRSFEDGNSGVPYPYQLIKSADQRGCKRMLRRSQRNTVMCSEHRNNCCGQESVFVLPITWSTSGSKHKNFDPRPDPAKIVGGDPMTRDPMTRDPVQALSCSPIM